MKRIKINNGKVVELDNNKAIYNTKEYFKLLGKELEKEITLDELEKMELDQWNYPLDEIDHIEELNLEVVIVRFLTDIKGKYEYRFCEITDYSGCNW